MSRKPKVAFICVHNSCRSQIAEAIAKNYSDVFEAYSAGTEVKPQINQDAVRIMKEVKAIDLEKSQKSKLIDDLPKIDITVTMGCDVVCPFLVSAHEEDWALEDPTGQSDEKFKELIGIIDEKMADLAHRIQSGKLSVLLDQ